MELLDFAFSLEDLLAELPLLHPIDRVSHFALLMLRDGFEPIACKVPEGYRNDVAAMLREAAQSDVIVGWRMVEEPNIYREKFVRLVEELERSGWPQPS